jgi:hypothetical protein
MILRSWKYAGTAAVFLVVGLAAARAGEPAPQRGTPIIFSEPKSDTVSSNLNQLDLKASSFKGLESDLKKPFEIFEWGQSSGAFRPPGAPIAPPITPANNRRLKEILDKRAEMMLFGPDKSDSDLTGDDPFKPSEEDGMEAASRKLKTPLDRYYDRLDRERSAMTNQVRNADALGDKKDSTSKDWFGGAFPDKPFGGDLKTSVNSLGRPATNAAASSGFFSDQLKPKTFEELLDGPPKNLAERDSSAKETRLDEFINLLDRTSYAPNGNNYSPGLPVTGTTQRPTPASPWSTWSSPSSPSSALSPSSVPSPHDSFAVRAGLVGALPQLQSLPSIATTPNLNPPPPPVLQPKPPVSTFSIPKRQF